MKLAIVMVTVWFIKNLNFCGFFFFGLIDSKNFIFYNSRGKNEE